MIRCNQENHQKKFKNIEIISFDAGFTLLEPNPSFGGILAAEAELLGYRCEPEILNERLFRAHHKYVQVSRNLGKGMYACQIQSKYFWDKITIEAFGQFIDSKDAQQLADECYDRLSTGKAWRLFDDVLPTLNYLSEKGYRLIVLSNWDDRLPNILKELGIAEHFEKIYCSTHTGAEKPDRDFFQYAMDDLKVHPSLIMHIGDHPVDDLQGANNMGMKGAVVKRNITISPMSPDPTDFSINSLMKLRYYL